MRAVTWSENPEKLGVPSFHSEHWDPFWRACDDHGMVVCLHIGSSSAVKLPSVEAPFTTMMNLQPTAVMDTAADLLWSRVIREFPDIRFALSEGSIGWIPYLLERADYVYEHHSRWTGSDFGGRLPSEVFRDHFLACFIEDCGRAPPAGPDRRRHRVRRDRLPALGLDLAREPRAARPAPRGPRRATPSRRSPTATPCGTSTSTPSPTVRPRTARSARCGRWPPTSTSGPPSRAGRSSPPERPLTLIDMLTKAEHPLLDEQAKAEGVAADAPDREETA